MAAVMQRDRQVEDERGFVVWLPSLTGNQDTTVGIRPCGVGVGSDSSDHLGTYELGSCRGCV